MRPRLIQGVPGLDPNDSAFERFTQFARRIAAVPKSELENEMKKSGSAKNGAGLKKRKASNANGKL
jgi:hypothetical protein